MLDISSNKLKEIPDCIGNLTKMSVLKIQMNEIELISPKIVDCAKLSMILMERNKIQARNFPFVLRNMEINMLGMDSDLCQIFNHDDYGALSRTSKKNMETYLDNIKELDGKTSEEAAAFIKNQGGALTLNTACLPSSDWRVVSANYCNTISKGPWVMFENGTSVFFAPEWRREGAAGLQKAAVEFLKKHANYPLKQNREWGDYGFVRIQEKFQSTMVYGYADVRPSSWGGEEDEVAIKVFVEPAILPEKSSDFMIYFVAAKLVNNDAEELKIVHTFV
eukprot:TRINITY_DN926_c0_g1_i1.p1 TRINITY_DN926_c0_g1~~TRINITY_DN926_c0_g1_i1.p1  ORF type:complete len:278 (-),score=54.35 TRINITY_DN926_c0_g1_i1:44-877(-)